MEVALSGVGSARFRAECDAVNRPEDTPLSRKGRVIATPEAVELPLE
jgi:hypothetical protein